MLPQIIALPSCLWVATLAVFALPMPPGGKDTAMVFGPQPPMIADLHIIIARMNIPREHSMIGIHDTVLHAIFPDPEDRTPDTILIAEGVDIPMETLKEDHHSILSGQARFKDEKDLQEAIEEMLKVKMPPIHYKGTCRDYIWQVLQKLKVRGNIIAPGVLRKFRTIYNERYEQVFKDTHRKLGIESGTI
ncbi:hypothetical protein C8J55DRAFT_494325 [Lentinula edodes]|uniref:Secreted protein n=1 Tax=Lentinula lateritia TaxID=40482 RepID=A0A9W9DCL0_9AGAR|nr:hypothetical protein C8J55DRAFT_494325 [Lentinula edodes]